MLTSSSKLCALSDTFCSLLLALTHRRAGRNGISCPHMIQVKSVLWSYTLVQSVKVSMIKHHQLSYFTAFCCLLILPLVLEGGTGIMKYKTWFMLQMESENVVDFFICVPALPIPRTVLRRMKKPKCCFLHSKKWRQGTTEKVHGQIPFCLNCRETNEQRNLQSFDLRMSLANTKICLKFLLFYSATLPFAFLCCVMNVPCPHVVTVALCLKPH